MWTDKCLFNLELCDFFRGLNDRTCTTWRDDKVKVMAVCPWVVDTDLVREVAVVVDVVSCRRLIISCTAVVSVTAGLAKNMDTIT